ncbi:MAG: SdpI family protein [Victivallaceae bacterium]
MLTMLPARIPIHWNLAGQADGWGSPFDFWIFFQASTLILGLVYLFQRWQFRTKPQWRLSAGKVFVIILAFFDLIMAEALALAWYSTRFGAPGDKIITAIFMLSNLAFLVLMYWKTPTMFPGESGNSVITRRILLAVIIFIGGLGIFAVAGTPQAVRNPNWTFLGMGLLFIVIGNLMPKLKTNPWAGIRIKWTMADPEIWYKTHRWSGRLWMIGGALLTVASLGLPARMMRPVFFATILILSSLPVLYAWRLARRKKAAAES